VAKKNPIKFVVNVGDNFYFEGVTDTCHWHWRDSFENMYSDPAFHVPFLSVLGNHDYGGDCCARELFGGCNSAEAWLGFGGNAHPTAQFEYDTHHDWQWPEKKEGRWVMPYWNYQKIFDMGPYKVQILAIDTNVCDIAKQCTRMGGCSNSANHPEVKKRGCSSCGCFLRKLWLEQLEHLERELSLHQHDDSIKWRFVIGHHPHNFMYPGDGPSQRGRFLRILQKYNVQVYFVGHVHSSRHDIIAENVHQVMTGASGGFEWQGGMSSDTIWSAGFGYGFAHMEMTSTELKVNYISDRGEVGKTVVIQQQPKYRYEAGGWGQCNNACGKGKQERKFKCISDKTGSEVSEDNCVSSGLIKPNAQGECYSSEKPKVEYCTQCGHDGSCSRCVNGFHLQNGKCTFAGRFLRVEYGVVAPAADDWRDDLDAMLHAALANATTAGYEVHTAAVFHAGEVDSADHVKEVVRLARVEYDLTHFVVEAVVAGQSEGDEKKMVALLQKYKSDIGKFPDCDDANCPDVSSINTVASVCDMKTCGSLALDESLISLQEENAALRDQVKQALLAQNAALKEQLVELV